MSAGRGDRRRPGRPGAARRRGFSLVELAVVAVIMGVLAAMAVPSYRRAMAQTRADLAAANLRTIWAAERLYYLEYRVYTADPNVLAALGALSWDLMSGDKYYSYTITTSNPAVGFTATATATPAGGMAAYGAGVLAVDETGVFSDGNGNAISVGF